MTYLLLIVLVVGINLLPAFGPPTWAVLVYFKINHDMEPVSLVVIGAVCAGAGRWVLAAASERLVPHLSEVRQEKLQAARTLLTRRRRSTAALVVLFLISPLPSAPLFLAALVALSARRRSSAAAPSSLAHLPSTEGAEAI